MFNGYLRMKSLKGKAVLAVDTKRHFRPRPEVSTATILSLSDQRPAMVLWSMTLLWGLFCLYRHRRLAAMDLYGGLALVDGRFVLAQRDISLLFRGSKNQRIIDVQQSLQTKTIVPATW